MKVLAQGNMPYPTAIELNRAISKIGPMAVISDMEQIAKALNDYNPDLLIIEDKYIDGVVQAYRNKNNMKVVCFANVPLEQSKADVIIPIYQDTPKPNLDILTFKENANKKDVSVFCDGPQGVFITQFLCQNYNVKAYGPIKINSPRYLGQLSNVEKYEILNKSKAAIVFNPDDTQTSILLDTYPISFSKDKLTTMSFTNLISLTECMDNIPVDGISESMSSSMAEIKNNYKSNNNLAHAINIIKQLGFNQEAERLNQELQEIIK